jgi:hypothetical protein
MRILYVLGGYGEMHIANEVHREFAPRGHRAWPRLSDLRPRAAARGGGRGSRLARRRRPRAPRRRRGRFGTDLVNAATRPLLRFPWFPSGLLGLLRFLRTAAPFDLIVADNAYPLGAMVSLATRAFPAPFVATLSGGDFIANRAAGYGYARYGAAAAPDARHVQARRSGARALTPRGGGGPRARMPRAQAGRRATQRSRQRLSPPTAWTTRRIAARPARRPVGASGSSLVA